MAKERKYNEHELRQLMHRATVKQRQSTEPDADGLSLDEIKRIAEEVGVNPRFVELAAEELGDDSFVAKQSKFFGGVHEFSIRRRVRGNLDNRSMAAAASAIRHHSKNDPGHIETFGDSMQWRTSTSNATRSTVSLTQDEDHCVIEASSSFVGYGAILFIAPFLLTFIGSIGWAVEGNAQIGLGLLAIAAALAFAMRFAFRAIANAIQSNSLKLVQNLESIVAQEHRESAATTPATAGSVTFDDTVWNTANRGDRVDSDLLRDSDAFGPHDGKAEQTRKRNKSWL